MSVCFRTNCDLQRQNGGQTGRFVHKKFRTAMETHPPPPRTVTKGAYRSRRRLRPNDHLNYCSPGAPSYELLKPGCPILNALRWRLGWGSSLKLPEPISLNADC